MALHEALLHDMGVILFEHLVLRDAAADSCVEGFFVALPLPVTGASGSPVNPVLIG